MARSRFDFGSFKSQLYDEERLEVQYLVSTSPKSSNLLFQYMLVCSLVYCTVLLSIHKTSV